MKASVHNPLKLSFPEGTAFYAKRTYHHIGPPPEIAFPQPWNSLVARFLHGTWSLFRIRSPQGPLELQYGASEGHRYVVIDLDENDTVCFHHHSLVGFSGGVTLSTAITLQLSAVSLGRMFFHLAKGPGLLVLDSHGEPQIIEDLRTEGALPPARLLCWSKDTEFSLIGSQSDPQVLLDSPLFFQLEKNRLVVIDAAHGAQHKSSSVFSILKKIYLPWL
ncbi:AIM24 family protein [Prosthecobacter sp.]|uniref:AIM24 family protein n=1 Tax=Prosthecobacter sp. TaxID=1965333 RepID=UPI003784029A